ncbi:MAG: hypothetical protein RIQ33_963 [Bacteroidota bacterium]
MKKSIFYKVVICFIFVISFNNSFAQTILQSSASAPWKSLTLPFGQSPSGNFMNCGDPLPGFSTPVQSTPCTVGCPIPYNVLSGVTPIWTNPIPTNASGSSECFFVADFNITETCSDYTLSITSDDVSAVFINGTLIGSGINFSAIANINIKSELAAKNKYLNCGCNRIVINTNNTNDVAFMTCKLVRTYTQPPSIVAFANSMSTNATCCIGNTLSLSSLLFNSVPSGTIPAPTYTWTGPNGFIATGPNATIPNFSTANVGLYTLSFGQPCCKTTSTVNVTVDTNPFTFSSLTSSTCAGSATINVTGTGLPGTAHITTSYNGVLLGTTSVPSNLNSTLNYSLPGVLYVPGVFTFTITSAAGCVYTSTLTIPPCCNDFVDKFGVIYSGNILSNTTSSFVTALNASNPIYTRPGIVIDGKFTIDNNFTFLNCPEIRLTKNARIEFAANTTARLVIDNAWLHACQNYMWAGTFLSSPNHSIVVKNNSLIEDAVQAIYSNTGLVYCHNSIFNRNYIGVMINGMQNYVQQVGAALPENSICNNTYFYCDNVSYGVPPPHNPIFLTKSVLISPYQNHRSRYGMMLFNCGNSINKINLVGNPVGFPVSNLNPDNKFSNCDVGLYLGGNNYMNLSFNIFDNNGLTPSGTIPNVGSNIGIDLDIAKNNNVNLTGGYGSPNTNNFKPSNRFINSYIGIRVDNSNVNMDHNSFGNRNNLNTNFNLLTKAVFVKGLQNNKSFYCRENDFQSYNIAIHTNNNAASRLSIIDNYFQSTLTNTIPSSIGIKIEENTALPFNKYFVSGNTIVNNNYAIWIKNVIVPGINPEDNSYLWNTNISQNTITYNSYLNAQSFGNYQNFNGCSGIYLDNTQNIFVQCNDIKNVSPTYFTSAGMHFRNNSLGNFITGNMITKAAKGILVDGPNQNYLLGNSFNQNLDGVYLKNNGDIGEQGNSTITSIGCATKHWGNEWILPSWAGAYATYSTNGSNISQKSNFIVNQSDIGNGMGFGSANIFNDLTSSPIRFKNSLPNTTPYFTNQDCVFYSQERLASTDINPETMDLARTNNVNLLNAEEGMTTFFAQMHLYEQLKTNPDYRDSIGTLDSFMQLATFQPIGNFYNMQLEIAAAFDSSLFYLNDIDRIPIRNAHLQTAMQYNDEAQGLLPSVEYYKNVNHIFLQSLIADSLSYADSINNTELLINIAYLCPTIYGPAVNNARSLLTYLGYEPLYGYNDDSICINSNARMASSHSMTDDLARINEANNYYATLQLDKVSTSNNKLIIFPNPTNNAISFTYTGIELNSTLAITSYLGMELYTEKLLNTEGKQNLDISRIENGLYLIQIRNNKGLLISQSKLNVVK